MIFSFIITNTQAQTIPPTIPSPPAGYTSSLPETQCISYAWGWLESFQYTVLNDPITGQPQAGERSPSADLYKGGWTYTPITPPNADGYPTRASSTPDSAVVIDADTKPTELDSTINAAVNNIRSGTGEEWLYIAKVEGRVGAQDTVTYSKTDVGAQEHWFVAAFDSSGNLLAKVPTAANASVFGAGIQTTDLTFTFPADGVAYLYTWVADYMAGMGIQTFDNCLMDYGDAPDSYATLSGSSGPTHVIGHLYMGANRNDEDDATITSGDASDDVYDDGVTIPATIIPSLPITISVDVVDIPTNQGYLQGWIDWNGDGDFADAGEQITTDAQDGGTGDNDGTANGTIELALTVPATAIGGITYSRFRWSSTSGLGSSGPADDGEVEDYEVTITSATYPLTLIKTASPKVNVPAGQTVTYTYAVTNTTNFPVSNIKLSDVHNGSGPPPAPNPDLATLTDNGTTGDSSNSTTGDSDWDVLAPGDTITVQSTYIVTQNDVETLQ